ncbi:short-chain dehydrogenase tic 32 [Quercus suber]|uniref:Short-chain dehydrogenase tic 32 n=1 Tax=Quercus suber TaxID=58331 RepID=A0AAW0MAP9_QUESU
MKRASSGIGTETTRVLALRGVHVIMGVRNMVAGKDAKEAIIKEIPTAKVDVMELDLSSMASVRKFASDFNSSGHFLLTNLLLENMKKTSRKSGKEGRIVNVSSEGHRFSYREGIRFDKLNDKSGYMLTRIFHAFVCLGLLKYRYCSFAAYGQSKLSNVLHANELARTIKDDGVEITANSLHPGAIATNIYRQSNIMTDGLDMEVSYISMCRFDISYMTTYFDAGIVNTLGRFVLKNVQQGAATTCYVALHPQVKGVSGEYFSDSNLSKASTQGRDSELAKKLWDFSMNLIK